VADDNDSTSTASPTMAALASNAARRYGSAVAARFRDGDEWAELTYAELWEKVRDLALGLIRLGVQPGDRVCILANTRVEWTIADLAVCTAAAIVVPVYPTNSPDECEWVVGNSGARVVICEDATQIAKIEQVRPALPDVEHLLVIDGPVDGITTLDELAATGRDGDEAALHERIESVSLDDPTLFIYTSGTTGRPKGVVLTHDGFAAGRRATEEMGLLGRGDVIYLYLPLAHVFAQVIQAGTLEVGATIAFFGGDTTKIIAELGEVRPTVLPSVPRIFEKLYSMAVGSVADHEREQLEHAVDLGVKVRLAEQTGEAVPDEERSLFEQAEDRVFGFVRSLFGGQLRFAISGAAPIAPEILRFFYAAGVPVFEGWGMTETTSLGSINLPDAFRFGTIGKALPGVEMKIADDGEILLRGPVLFREYWRNPDATAETISEDGFLLTGDLGAIDDEGYFTITGRKKDIIITAGGKNLTPANLEGDLRQSLWISQAVMYGDRRPYPVAIITLDPETMVPWAEERGLPTDMAELARTEEVRALIQAELDAANAKYAQVEQIKRFAILDHDFTQDTGELTPTMKLKRNVIYGNHAELFDDLYR